MDIVGGEPPRNTTAATVVSPLAETFRAVLLIDKLADEARELAPHCGLYSVCLIVQQAVGGFPCFVARIAFR